MSESKGYLLDEETMEILSTVVRFVCEDGFSGFLAHVEQRVAKLKAGECDCGGTHDMPAVSAVVVRLNVDRLKVAIEVATA